MVLAAPSLRITGLVLALVVATSCGGRRVRLGDATGGNAGTAAAAGAGNGGNTSASGGSAGDHPGSGGGGEGGASCERGRVNPNAVVWIGDSWVTIPSTQHTRVRDLARASGALGPDEDYVILAAPSTSIAAIANQYSSQQAGPIKVEVLIMDGGTWDTLTAGGSDSSVAKAVSGFKQLLSTVASDGTVTDIVYFLQPELPSIDGVAALRPELMQACQDSAVPCYFIDLQPLWVGHPEYTASDGIQASEAGATVIADQIWATMREHCIAQ